MLSLYFNNIRIPDWIKVTNISESLIPSFEASRFKTIFKTRVIQVDFSFTRNMNLDKERKSELLEFIKGDNFTHCKLSLPNHNDRYYLAKVTDISDIDGTIRKGSGTITFTCFDYREYEATKTIATATNNSLKINYLGTEEVYPTIKINIKSNCNKIKINFSNGSSTSYLEFNANFKTGDILILEQSTNKLTLNGVDNSAIWHLNSKRNKLSYGLNTYTIESGSIDFTLEFNTAYL
ncbi:phage distal tail protein [Sarcina ventriculi]